MSHLQISTANSQYSKSVRKKQKSSMRDPDNEPSGDASADNPCKQQSFNNQTFSVSTVDTSQNISNNFLQAHLDQQLSKVQQINIERASVSNNLGGVCCNVGSSEAVGKEKHNSRYSHHKEYLTTEPEQRSRQISDKKLIAKIKKISQMQLFNPDPKFSETPSVLYARQSRFSNNIKFRQNNHHYSQKNRSSQNSQLSKYDDLAIAVTKQFKEQNSSNLQITTGRHQQPIINNHQQQPFIQLQQNSHQELTRVIKLNGDLEEHSSNPTSNLICINNSNQQITNSQTNNNNNINLSCINTSSNKTNKDVRCRPNNNQYNKCNKNNNNANRIFYNIDSIFDKSFTYMNHHKKKIQNDLNFIEKIDQQNQIREKSIILDGILKSGTIDNDQKSGYCISKSINPIQQQTAKLMKIQSLSQKQIELSYPVKSYNQSQLQSILQSQTCKQNEKNLLKVVNLNNNFCGGLGSNGSQDGIEMHNNKVNIEDSNSSQQKIIEVDEEKDICNESDTNSSIWRRFLYSRNKIKHDKSKYESEMNKLDSLQRRNMNALQQYTSIAQNRIYMQATNSITNTCKLNIKKDDKISLTERQGLF